MRQQAQRRNGTIKVGEKTYPLSLYGRIGSMHTAIGHDDHGGVHVFISSDGMFFYEWGSVLARVINQ